MSVKKRDDNEWALALIASFLNTILPGAMDRKWQAFTKKCDTIGKGTYHLARMGLHDAINLRCEMHEALSFLRAQPRQLKKEQNPYAELIYLLNDLKVPTAYQASEVRKGRTTWPGQARFRSRDGRRWAVLSWPVSNTPKEILYGFLAGALIRGTLNRLKVCRHCGKYIVVRDIKREFCPGTNCKIDYFNALKPRVRARPAIEKKPIASTEEAVLIACGCRMTWKGDKLVKEELCPACEREKRERLERVKSFSVSHQAMKS